MKVNKRYRRALPRIRTASLGSGVRLLPYDEVSAKAQRIVTGGETVDDAYIGHVQIQSHLIIASNQCLWAIDKKSREPWCVSWTEISSFGIDGGDCMKVEVFSSFGSVTYVFEMSSVELADCYALLSIQAEKMVSVSLDVEILTTLYPDLTLVEQITGKLLTRYRRASNAVHR
jgi:hypothetical protein